MNSSCNTEDRNGFEDINSTQEQVDFNSMDVYPPGSDVTVFYTLGSRVSATPNDWIGIFLNGFRDTRHPLTFQWTTKASDTITTLERKATFSNKLIQPLESVTLKYQFAYINKKNEVLGLSRPFMIKYKESWDLDMELYETVPKGDCSLDGPLALSDSSSGTSESPVLLSIDDDWELANDSPCNKHASLSDLSDIVVLSTSPSKESAKTEAKSEALIKDDTVDHAAKNFAPTCLKRKPTLPFSPTRAEGSLSENVSVEKEMQVTEASQEKAEIDKEFCDKQSISDGNKGIKTEGLAQICTNTKRDRRKKSKKKPEEIVCIEHNPSSFVDRLKLLGDESMSEEESSETYNLSQDRKILIEVINGGESDCCKSKVSQAKQNKRCKKRKNKNVLESSQQVRENYGANTADTECMENDKKSHHWLHKTMSTDHSNRLKKSHDYNVSETDVRSETTRTSRKNKSRKTETVETLSKHNAEIIDEISIGKKICLKTEQGNPRKKKDIQKGRKSDQELKENLIETDVEKITVVHIPGEELKALKKKYCRSSKTKRNKQQHIRKKTDVFCNLQNLFAEISIEGETPVPESQEDCPKVEEMSSSLLKDVSDQGFPALPSQHNTPPELVKSNSQMVPSIRTDITAPEENKGNSQNIARGLAFSSSSDRPAYIPAYLLDIMDALPPPRGNNDVKDLKECDNMLLHKTSKSVLQAFKAKYKVKSARKSELQKMKLRSKYFHTKSGIVDRIQNQFLDPNCNLQNKDNTWKFFQEPEECLTADVLMDGPQTALVPSCQGSTSEVKPALVPSCQGSTSEVKPALVPSCQGSTSEVKPALVPSCQGSTSEVKPALVPSCQGSTSEVKPALVPSCQGSTSEVKRTSYANVVKKKTQDTKELVGTKVQLQPNDSASTCASSYVNGKAKRVSVVQNNNRTRSTALRTLAKLLRKRARNLRENKICVQNEIFCQEKNINDHTITPQDIGLKHSEQIGDLTYTSTAERREICNVESTAERREICNVESTAERREICNVESTAERREICNVESTAERREICNVESTAERREICNVESTAEIREICNVESTAERREIYRTKDTAGLKKSTFGETKEKDAVLLFRPAVRTPTKKAFHSCRSPPKREIETNKDTKRQTEEISWEKAVETTVSPVTMWSTRSPLKDKVESVAVEEMRRVKGNNIRSNEEHVILNRRVAICKWAGQVKSLVRSNTEIVCLRSQVKESNQEIISLQNQVNSLKEALSIETKRLAKANMKWLKLKIKYKELKARKIEDGNKEADKLVSVKNDANISSDTTDLLKSPPRKRKWSLEDPSGYGYSQAPSICIKDELNSPPRKRRRSDNFPSGNPYVKENTSLIELEPEEANRVYASYNLLSESSTPKHYNFFCHGQSCRQEAVGVKVAQILNPPKYVSQTRASFNGASSHLDSYSHYCVQSKTSPPHLPLSNLSQAGLPKTSPPHLPLFNLSQAGLPKSSPPHLPLPFPNQTTCHVSPLHPVYPNAIYPQSFFPPQEAQKDEKSQFSQATHQYRLNYRNPLLAQNTCMGSPRENCASPSRKQRYTSRSPSYRGVSESVLAFNHMASSYHPRPTCSTTNDATPYQHCHNPHVLQYPLGQSGTPAPTCGHPVTAVHDARLCWNPKSQVAASDPTSAAYLTVYAQEGTSNMKEGTARDDDEYYRLRADASEKPSEKNQVSNNLVLLASGPKIANKCNLYPVRHVYQLSHPTYQSTKHSDNSSPDRQHQVERMFEGKPEIATAKLHNSDVFFQSHFLKQLVKDENMNHVYNAKQIQNSSMQPQAAKMLPFNQCFSGDDNVELAENDFRGSISESFCRKQKLFYQDGEQKYWNDQNGYVPLAGMTENCLADDIDERKVQSRTEMLNRSNKQKPALACKHAGTAFENSMPVLELSANGTIGFPGEVLSSSFCHHKAMMCETCHHKNMMCGACTPMLEINQVNLVNLENRPIEASGACHRAF